MIIYFYISFSCDININNNFKYFILATKIIPYIRCIKKKHCEDKTILLELHLAAFYAVSFIFDPEKCFTVPATPVFDVIFECGTIGHYLKDVPSF